MEELLKLSEEKDLAVITKCVQQLSIDPIFKVICKEASKGNPSVVTALRILFRGLSSAAEKRKNAYIKIIDMLGKVEVTSRLASDIIGIMLIETDSLPSDFLPQVISKLTEAIKKTNSINRKIADLIPKVMCSLASRITVDYEGSELTGQECKAKIVEKLCSTEWEPANGVIMASVFREIPLTLSEKNKVIEKLVKLMDEMEIQEVPALIYQLLLLSTQGLRENVLKLIIEYFNKQDQRVTNSEFEIAELIASPISANSLLHVEGTVILHVTFAAKQDQELGKAFVKLLKSCQNNPAYILTPFAISLALSLAKIMHYGEQIINLVKSAILQNFRQSEKMTESYWLRRVMPETVDGSPAILQAVDNTKNGWDYVSQGFVQLGFLLMDSYGPKAHFGKSVDNQFDQNPTSATYRACNLGSKIIENIFKICTGVRSEVITQLINRILTKNSSPVSHYVTVLTNTVKSVPQFYLDSVDRIQEVIQSLPFLSYTTSISVLTALTPLVKISMPLKDSLMVVLRKALFHRNLEARKVSVAAFAMVLKNFRILGGIPLSQSSYISSQPMSQVEVDVHSRYNSGANEALCLELLSIIKRSLTQQPDVKEILYKELPKVLAMNPHLASAIMGLLLSQFQLYFEEDENVNPPLKLSTCVLLQGDQPVQLKEPLSCLLLSIQQCILACMEQQQSIADIDDDDDMEITDHNFNKLHKMMNTLVGRMIEAELEDFELDKSAQFNASLSMGAKNQILASQLLEIYQVLMEYCFMTAKDNRDSYQNIIALYINHKKLKDVLKEKAESGDKEGKGRKGAKASNKTAQIHTEINVISLRCISEMLGRMFCEAADDEQDAIDCLVNHEGFTTYLLAKLNGCLHQLQEKVHHRNTDKTFNYCCAIGKALTSKIFPSSTASTQVIQDRNVIWAMCIDEMANLLHFIDSNFPQKVSEFLMAIEGKKSNQTSVTLNVIKKYQDIVTKYLSLSDKDKKMKELVPVLDVIALLSKHVREENSITIIYTWAKELCSQQAISEIVIVKLLLNICLKLSCQGNDLPSLIRDLAEDLHQSFGDMEDTDLSVDKKYAIVLPRTGSSVCLILLNGIELMLEEVEWVITYLRSSIGTSTEQDRRLKQILSSSEREQKESNLCSRLGFMVTSFQELTQAKLPIGSCSDAVIKLLTKFYSTIAMFIKYYIAVYSQKVGHICSRFDKLIKLLGGSLTPHVYLMITYVLGADQDSSEPTHQGKKATKPGSASKKLKIERESKMIPALIFTIEQYERYLLQLSKKSKTNLMQHIKLSTSRDFRINISHGKELTQDAPTPSDEEQENSDAADNEN